MISGWVNSYREATSGVKGLSAIARHLSPHSARRVVDFGIMKIPAAALIPAEKLTNYLLLPRPWDDKAKFLAQAGFDRANPEALLGALRDLAAGAEAVQDGVNEYGEFFRTDGDLIGPNGRRLAVTAIWLRQHADGQVRFVTLKPRRERRP